MIVLFIETGLYSTNVNLLNEDTGTCTRKIVLKGSLGEVVDELVEIINDVAPPRLFFTDSKLSELLKEHITERFNLNKIVNIGKNGFITYKP